MYDDFAKKIEDFQPTLIAMTTDSYDISSDGQQFLLAQQEKGSEQPEIAVTVVQNWYKELQDHK